MFFLFHFFSFVFFLKFNYKKGGLHHLLYFIRYTFGNIVLVLAATGREMVKWMGEERGWGVLYNWITLKMMRWNLIILSNIILRNRFSEILIMIMDFLSDYFFKFFLFVCYFNTVWFKSVTYLFAAGDAHDLIFRRYI